MKHHHQDLVPEEFMLFVQGDQRVFRLVFDRYYAQVYRYVKSLTADEQEIEDIVQQCFIQLFKHKLSIKDPAGVYPYLFVIAKRLVIMSFRKRVMETRYQTEAILTLSANCKKTENKIEFNELQSLLDREIDLLPPKQREIYRLCKIEGYSYGETATMTGCSINTVRNHLVAASKTVRSEISKHYLTSFVIIFLLN